jgi:hypothetical protein
VLVRISERIKDATATMAAPVITKFVHAIILIIDCARSFFLSSSFCLLLNIRRANKGYL